MRAVFFGLLADGSTTTDVFEGEGCLDRAHAFRESVAPDFPDGLFAVTGDETAVRHRKRRIWLDFGGDPDEFEGTGRDCCDERRPRPSGRG